ncbi:MAG: MgtC/SapB family protein [Terriglobales bacterium]
MFLEHQSVVGIAIAALGGAAVGLEREWSGHAGGPEAHFAGIRTFTLLGGLAGVAGWLWSLGLRPMAIVLLAGATVLVVAAYVAASRRVIDGTTEVAALVVLSAGILAGTGYLVLASAITAITTLLLVEKSRLHAMIARIDDAGLRAGVRFAVMAVVILPLLPEGPYGPLGGVQPRQLWLFVLLFSGLSFIGYVARRVIGTERGYSVAGLLGGFVSSTAVAFTFARLSRQDRNLSFPLSVGVVAACSVMTLRVLVATAVLRPALALALIPYLAAPFLVGAIIILIGFKRREEKASVQSPSNPLQVMSALQMAALFQAVLFAVYAVRAHWGEAGVLFSGAVLGLTDVDVLTISMAKSAEGQIAIPVAAQAIAIGILSNTIMKLLLGVAIGKGRFRILMPAWLALMAIASAASIAALR